MNNEIDTRALIYDNLESEYFEQNCSFFCDDDSPIKLIMRNFNTIPKWSIYNQTNFIESIFMGCEVPLIILFKDPTDSYKHIIVDGYNRVKTIQDFLNGDLRLNKKGIEKLEFLKEKTFEELDEEVRNYFKSRGIQLLIFSYHNKNVHHELTELETETILKLLYTRFNSGTKLKNEEIQKANYNDDEITKNIMLQIKTNPTFLEALKSIYFTPIKNTKTFIESTLMYCRLAITSCYAPLEDFCKSHSITKQIDNFYTNYTIEYDKDNIFKFFCDLVYCLHEIVKQDYWKSYPELHNRYFTLICYWLYFQIKKYNLIINNNFSWKNFINYFGKKEQQEKFFSSYRTPLILKYKEVIKYIQENYNIDLNEYIIKTKESKNKNLIKSFDDLPKYNFQLPRNNVNIAGLLSNLEENKYILRPSYQRREINDLKYSSNIIESALLNINIPDILVYKYKQNNDYIFEVIDGQQRCWSFISYLKRTYHNALGEITKSEKDNFALTGLTILSELNNKKVDAIKKANNLSNENINKILSAKTRIVILKDENNPYFSVKDYFTRINKTIAPLPKTSFAYWNVTYDNILMKKANDIAAKYQGDVLPKPNKKYTPQQYVVSLAYLFFNNKKDLTSFSLSQINNWLFNFEKIKAKKLNINEDNDIENIRKNYKNAFDKVDIFLNKLSIWLNSLHKTINELINYKYKYPFYTLLCLYYFLGYADETDITNNSTNIYNIISSFFNSKKITGLKTKEDLDIVKEYIELLSPNFQRLKEKNAFNTKLLEQIKKYEKLNS